MIASWYFSITNLRGIRVPKGGMRDESPVKDVESWKLKFVLIGASNIINWWKSEGGRVVKSYRLRIRNVTPL